MTIYIDVWMLKSWLSDGDEIALIDVREHGQYGEGHLFFAVPLAYSTFELGLAALVPNPGVRLVLYDNGDGVAELAAGRAEALGYKRAYVLHGGAAAWLRVGNTLFSGVNVPSKTLAELVEVERRTPHISADKLRAMSEAEENMVIVDGRSFSEFQRMNVPGGVCCPNGELALRIDGVAPDPRTTIIVNCAGRTRSIVGAQTLIDLGIANPVFALENGTQGWSLAGLQLEKGASRRYQELVEPAHVDARRARARALAESRGARFVGEDEVAQWVKDDTRTTYLIDIRTEEEYSADGSPHFTHAPGGQLIQATDQWIGVNGARIVLADSELIRAPVVAAWLRQLGHDANVFAGRLGETSGAIFGANSAPAHGLPLPKIAAAELHALISQDTVRIIDLRPSMAYREEHIAGAIWSIRPRLSLLADNSPATVVLVADQPDVAELGAIDLGEVGGKDIRVLEGGMASWHEADLPVVATPKVPADAECIDFLFFTHRRHLGDPSHSRQYLDWELGLIDQLDEQERASFKIVPAPAP